MKTSMVVTNLRIPKPDWLQIKAVAGELGMSVNQYVNFLIKSVSVKQELAEEISKRREDLPIWQLNKIAISKGKGLSKDDQVIYK